MTAFTFPVLPQNIPLKPWLNTLVQEELLKACPTLDFKEQDIDVLNICISDMRKHIDYLHTRFFEIMPKTVDIIQDGSVIGEWLQVTLDPNGISVPQESYDEMILYTKTFVHIWWKKWMERVKIVFAIPENAFDAFNPPPAPAFTSEEKSEIIEQIINTLFQYGEYCCPTLMANNLLASNLKASQRKEWSLENKINLRTSLIRQAKNMAFTKGPLILMIPNLKKLNSSLREFRSDDNMPKMP